MKIGTGSEFFLKDLDAFFIDFHGGDGHSSRKQRLRKRSVSRPNFQNSAVAGKRNVGSEKMGGFLVQKVLPETATAVSIHNGKGRIYGRILRDRLENRSK